MQSLIQRTNDIQHNRAKFRMFTITEAAEYYGLPKHFIRQLVLTKAVPSIKAGKKYLINENLLENFLQCGAVSDKI
jgi:excisionase family DNA binding protein